MAEGGLSVAWELREGHFRNRDGRGAASKPENSTFGNSCVGGIPVAHFTSPNHVNIPIDASSNQDPLIICLHVRPVCPMCIDCVVKSEA